MLTPFLQYPLLSAEEIAARLPENSVTKLHQHLKKARYSVRLLRYWWAAKALEAEAKRLGRPLVVVDVGCERGWLKHFTAEGTVAKWIGVDWNPPSEVTKLAQYDEVHDCNFDLPLPLESGVADAVVCLHVFEHLPRPGFTISEISRLIQEGGIFLGCTPTMPDFLAKLREKHFRRLLSEGKIAFGGHITVLSPKRWYRLTKEVGLDAEYVTGSHVMRLTGSWLENHGWWIRLNQFLAGIIPSLGSEACIQARRTPAWAEQSDRLLGIDPHSRKLWIALTACLFLSVPVGLYLLRSQVRQEYTEASIHWVSEHSEDGQVIGIKKELPNYLKEQLDEVVWVQDWESMLKFLAKDSSSQGLMTESGLKKAIEKDETLAKKLMIDGRLDLPLEDLFLVRTGNTGTNAYDYFKGQSSSEWLNLL